MYYLGISQETPTQTYGSWLQAARRMSASRVHTHSEIITLDIWKNRITYFFLFLLLALLRRKWQSTAPFTKSCRGVLSSCCKSCTAFLLAFCTASLHIPSSYSTPRILDTLNITPIKIQLINMYTLKGRWCSVFLRQEREVKNVTFKKKNKESKKPE
jgi:hypothetical protein